MVIFKNNLTTSEKMDKKIKPLVWPESKYGNLPRCTFSGGEINALISFAWAQKQTHVSKEQPPIFLAANLETITISCLDIEKEAVTGNIQTQPFICKVLDGHRLAYLTDGPDDYHHTVAFSIEDAIKNIQLLIQEDKNA